MNVALVTPSSIMRSASTRPCSTSDGAVRKYRSSSSYVVKSGDVLAGEKWILQFSTSLSMNVNDTPDDAAPMNTSAPAASWRSTVWLAMSVEVSPESPWSRVTSARARRRRR